MSYKMVRTSTESADFRVLEKKLDEELYEIYGDMQDNYATFNNVEDLKTIIVYDVNKPVACGCLKMLNNKSAEVKRVYVASGYRGKGISKLVMKELEIWAIEDNIKTLVLQTGSKQKTAINLYTSVGYSLIENFGPYVNDDNSVCMKKVLNAEESIKKQFTGRGDNGMCRIDYTNIIYNFSKNNNPVAYVHSGDEVTIETMDCFANQLQTEEDRLESMDWNRVNPATGPVYIEGAMPGDVLKVTVNKIELNNNTVVATGENLGVLGSRLQGLSSRICKIENNEVVFNESLRLPLNKMIGVIGVAPAEGEINSGTPDSHGGNMDNKLIAEGCILYLPVFVQGALFALGDLHAVMGDGEIGVSGAEAGGSVSVKLEVIKNIQLQNPLLENQDCICTIASCTTLDEAVNRAVSDMAGLLTDRLEISYSEVSMLLSLVGQAQICQVVDPLKTARYVVPKWVLEKYGFKLIK